MKKFTIITLIAMQLLCVCFCFAEANTGFHLAGKWTCTVNLANEFEYTGGDISSDVLSIWEFGTDSEIKQTYVNPSDVNAIVKKLMTNILTNEIKSDGETIANVASMEGYASVSAFVDSVMKREGIDDIGSSVHTGTYAINGSSLILTWPGENGNSLEVTYEISFEDETLILTDNTNSVTISLTRVLS